MIIREKMNHKGSARSTILTECPSCAKPMRVQDVLRLSMDIVQMQLKCHSCEIEGIHQLNIGAIPNK